MDGKVSVVTGANSGIGFVVAKELAKMGSTVVLVCRDEGKGKAAINEVNHGAGNQKAELMIADLASLASVRDLAERYKQKHDKLHVLINNAGVIMGKRVVTADGLETTFEVNYLSHFLLTYLLLDTMKASAPSRIVNVSSDAHTNGKMDFDYLQEEKSYSAMRSYSQSKLAQILFTHKLSETLKGSGVTVNAVHPGVVRTHWGDEGGALSIGIKMARPFMLSPEKGAETPIYVATSPDLDGVSGKYFTKKKETESSKESNSVDEAEKLWDISLKLSGLD